MGSIFSLIFIGTEKNDVHSFFVLVVGIKSPLELLEIPAVLITDNFDRSDPMRFAPYNSDANFA